jgi:hypothetical protein
MKNKTSKLIQSHISSFILDVCKTKIFEIISKQVVDYRIN